MKQLVDKRAIELETISGKKIIRDVHSLGVNPLSTNVTPLQLLQNGQGSFPLGVYKGGLAVTDLDKAVNQPLVKAEQEFMLGMLDGRTVGYDAVQATTVAGAASLVSYRARMTVPAAEVWFVHALQIYAPKDTTGAVNVNWRCSLWPDKAAIIAGTTPDADGQPFLAADGVGTNAINIWNFLFGVVPVTTNIGSLPVGAPGGTNAAYDLGITIATPKTLPKVLRLPGGTVLTLQITVNSVNATIVLALPVTMSVRGYVGKALVS